MSKDITPVYMSKFDNELYLATKPIENMNGRKPDFITGDISKGRYGNDLYNIYWGYTDKCVITEPLKPLSMDNWFSGFNGKTIEGLNLIDTSETISIKSMFNGCLYLKELDLSSWEVSKVENFREICRSCIDLEKINVSTWQTPQAKDMSGVFDNCSSLSSVDLSGFDTRNCESLENFFNNCQKLEDVSIGRYFEVEEKTMFFRVFNLCKLLKAKYGDINDKELVDKILEEKNIQKTEDHVVLKDLQKLKEDGHQFEGTIIINNETFKISYDTQTLDTTFLTQTAKGLVRPTESDGKLIQAHATEISKIILNALENSKEAIFIKDLAETEQGKFNATLVLKGENFKMTVDTIENKWRVHPVDGLGNEITPTKEGIELVNKHIGEISKTLRNVINKALERKQPKTVNDVIKAAQTKKAERQTSNHKTEKDKDKGRE